MSRYIEHQAQQQPAKESKKEATVKPTPGKYTSKELEGGKKRPFLGGNYNAGR